MASFTASAQADGIVRRASGSFTSDNTATTVTIGYTPRHVRVVNTSDATIYEWFDSMPANSTIKTVTAGTTTIDTTGAIVPTTNGFTLTAAAVGTAKNIAWHAA